MHKHVDLDVHQMLRRHKQNLGQHEPNTNSLRKTNKLSYNIIFLYSKHN